MADGEALPDSEIWLRVITEKNFVGDDGVIHDLAFSRGAIAQPRQTRAWQHEISGRRNSFCGNGANIAAHAQAHVDRRRQAYTDKTGHRAPSAWIFRAVIHALASELRPTVNNVIASNVIHTPIEPPDPNPDPAHTDFVTYGSTDADVDEVRNWLQKRLKVCWPNDLDQLTAAQPTPTMPTEATSAQSSTTQGTYQITPPITKA